MSTKSTYNIFEKGKLLNDFGIITFISMLCSFMVFVVTTIMYTYVEQLIAMLIAIGYGIGFLLNRLRYNKATRLYMTIYSPTTFMIIILLIGGFFGQALGFATMAFLAFIGYRNNPKLRILFISYDILAFIIPTIYISFYGPILGVIDVPYDEILVFLASLAWLSLTFRMYDENKTRNYTNSLEKNNTALIESEFNLKQTQLVLQNQNNKLAVLNNELNLKNKHIEEFTLMVTHDLRGPLNNINIIAKELQKQKALAKDSITDSYLLHLENSSARLNNLVNGLLQYAEIGNSSKMESLNIKDIIQQVLADMSEQIKINNATIIVGEMPVLVGRPNDIHMLFQNLIHNALKFISSDRNPTVKINSEKTPGFYKFSVEDNGIGIPENEIDNIFNAFHRLHNQSEFEGSGIGLYGCKKIIDHHQGEIWIESNENIGSKFFFTISTNLVEHKTIS